MNTDERFDQRIRAALEWQVERDVRRAPSLTQSAHAVAERLGPRRVGTVTVVGARRDPFGGLQIALLLLLMALLAIGIAVGSDLVRQPTRPAVAPFGLAENGQVAYGREGDIWVGDPGSGSTELFIGGPAYERRPVWSPDGSRLAFLRGERLFAIDADGGGLVQLTPDLLLDVGIIRWSPDGALIAVEHTIDGVSGVSIVRTDGEGAQRLDIGIEDSFPDWRPPDGRQLLLRSVAPTGVPDLYTVDPDGGALRSLGLASPRLDGGGTDLLGSSWSPDGRQILYGGLEFKDPVSGVNRYRTHIVNADGTGDRLIEAPPDRSDVWPVWSPDGRFIHFERVAGEYLGSDTEVWLAIARADGTGLVEISEVSDPSGLTAIWSPDGTRLLAYYVTVGGTFEIDPVAGTARVLAWTTGGDLSWQRR
jgi:dipeptidyl aminopeptidase/acylaminoacyl peptidase